VAKCALIRGRASSARATRTCSRPVLRLMPHRHESQCAQEFTPHSAQPWRASNSATSISHRQVAAARSAAASQIRRSSTSSGTCGASGSKATIEHMFVLSRASRTEPLGAPPTSSDSQAGLESVPRDTRSSDVGAETQTAGARSAPGLGSPVRVSASPEPPPDSRHLPVVGERVWPCWTHTGADQPCDAAKPSCVGLRFSSAGPSRGAVGRLIGGRVQVDMGVRARLESQY
jgi:hypothetical protein